MYLTLAINLKTFIFKTFSKLKRSRFTVPIILAILDALAFRSFLTRKFIFTTWDYSYPLSLNQAINSLKSTLYLVGDNYGLGFSDNQLPMSFYYWLINLALIAVFGIHANKVLIFVGSMIAGIGMYRLLENLKLGKFTAAVFGFLYMFNPFLFSRLIAGHYDLFLAAAFLPFFYDRLQDFFHKPGSFKLLVVIVLFILSSMHPVMLSINLFLTSALFLYFLITGSYKGKRILSVFPLLLFIICTNLHWILPMAVNFRSGRPYLRGDLNTVNEAVNRMDKFVKTGSPIIYPIFFTNTSELATEYAYPVRQPFFWYSAQLIIIISILVYLLRIFRKVPKVFWFNTGIYLVFLVLTSGSGNPVGKFIYRVLLSRLTPIFLVFSNSNRFLIGAIFAFTVVSAIAVSGLIIRFRVSWWYKLLIIFVVIIRTLAYFDDSFFKRKPENSIMPLAYHLQKLKSEDAKILDIISSPKEYRIGFLPPYQLSPVSSIELNWGSQAQKGYNGDYFNGTSAGDTYQLYIISLLVQKQTQTLHIGKMLGLANVGEIIFPQYDNYYYFWPFGTHSRTKFSGGLFNSDQSLERNINLQTDLISSEYNRIKLYKNNYNLPRIYGFNRIFGIVGGYEVLKDIAADSGFNFAEDNITFIKQTSLTDFMSLDGYILKDNDLSPLLFKSADAKYRADIMKNPRYQLTGYFRGEPEIAAIPAKEKGILLQKGNYELKSNAGGGDNVVLLIRFIQKPDNFIVNGQRLDLTSVRNNSGKSFIVKNNGSVNISIQDRYITIEDFFILPFPVYRELLNKAELLVRSKPFINYPAEVRDDGLNALLPQAPVSRIEEINHSLYTATFDRKFKYLYFSHRYNPDWELDLPAEKMPGGAGGIIFKPVTPQNRYRLVYHGQKYVSLGYILMFSAWIILLVMAILKKSRST